MIEIIHKREPSSDDWTSVVASLGLTEKLAAARTVAIKPNFAAGSYVAADSHVVSNLGMIAGVVRYVLAAAPRSKVYLCESDSTGYGFAFLKFRNFNLPDSLGLSIGELERVELLDMSRDELVRVENARFLRYSTVDQQLWLSKRLIEADFRIDLSNLKTHSVTGYTGACKNLFGCLPEMDKSLNHPYIHKTVHDLTLAINPDLNVIDAFYGMERNGPVQGAPMDSGFMIVSNDVVEADFYGSTCMGFKPSQVGYLKLLLRDRPCDVSALPLTIKVGYRKPQAFLRVMNAIGLAVQRVGQGIGHFGHKIHTAYNPLILFIAVFRPLLLRVFDLETLKQIKHRVMKG